jgi:hypothetical protein
VVVGVINIGQEVRFLIEGQFTHPQQEDGFRIKIEALIEKILADERTGPTKCPECGAGFYLPGQMDIALFAQREFRDKWKARIERETAEKCAALAAGCFDAHGGVFSGGCSAAICKAYPPENKT